MNLQVKLSDNDRKECDVNALELCDETGTLLTYIKPDMTGVVNADCSKFDMSDLCDCMKVLDNF